MLLTGPACTISIAFENQNIALEITIPAPTQIWTLEIMDTGVSCPKQKDTGELQIRRHMVL
jgi:hypothetical protein